MPGRRLKVGRFFGIVLGYDGSAKPPSQLLESHDTLNVAAHTYGIAGDGGYLRTGTRVAPNFPRTVPVSRENLKFSSSTTDSSSGYLDVLDVQDNYVDGGSVPALVRVGSVKRSSAAAEAVATATAIVFETGQGRARAHLEASVRLGGGEGEQTLGAVGSGGGAAAAAALSNGSIDGAVGSIGAHRWVPHLDNRPRAREYAPHVLSVTHSPHRRPTPSKNRNGGGGLDVKVRSQGGLKLFVFARVHQELAHCSRLRMLPLLQLQQLMKSAYLLNTYTLHSNETVAIHMCKAEGKAPTITSLERLRAHLETEGLSRAPRDLTLRRSARGASLVRASTWSITNPVNSSHSIT